MMLKYVNIQFPAIEDSINYELQTPNLKPFLRNMDTKHRNSGYRKAELYGGLYGHFFCKDVP